MGTAPFNYPPDASLDIGQQLTGNTLNRTAGFSTLTFFTAPNPGVYEIQSLLRVVTTDGAGSLALTIGTPHAGAIAAASGGGGNQFGTQSANLAGAGRVIGTVYQNTTGAPMTVEVIIVPGTQAVIELRTGAANPPTSLVQLLQNTGTSATDWGGVSVTGVIPAGYFYEINSSGSGETLLGWYELTASAATSSGASIVQNPNLATPTDGFMTPAAIWMNAGDVVSAAVVATSLGSTTYNVYVTARRLF